jgi:hypothetical protein
MIIEDFLMVSKISGPGCSSIGGETLELGPFFPEKGSKPKLKFNPYTWTKGWIILGFKQKLIPLLENKKKK